MHDPAVLRQKAKIKVIADESLERLLPEASGGRRNHFQRRHHVTERNDTVRGSPENPMTSEEVMAKARDLIAPVLGDEKCAKLIESLFALEEVGDIRRASTAASARLKFDVCLLNCRLATLKRR